MCREPTRPPLVASGEGDACPATSASLLARKAEVRAGAVDTPFDITEGVANVSNSTNASLAQDVGFIVHARPLGLLRLFVGSAMLAAFSRSCSTRLTFLFSALGPEEIKSNLAHDLQEAASIPDLENSTNSSKHGFGTLGSNLEFLMLKA